MLKRLCEPRPPSGGEVAPSMDRALKVASRQTASGGAENEAANLLMEVGLGGEPESW